MRNRNLSWLLLAACAVPFLALGAAGATPSIDAAQAKQKWALLNQYCSKCHNTDDWAGGVAFATMSPQHIPDDAKVWEAAIQKLSGRLMPPPGNPQPPQPSIDTFIHWMQHSIDHAALTHPAYTGWVGLHRLNRKEYAHAVWDLLRVKIDAERRLPKDDQADGFDNIADVLQVLNQYLESAREAASDAVGDAHATPITTQYTAGADSGDQLFRGPGMPLGSRGGFQVTHDFPADGKYELDIGNLAVALWLFNLEFKNHIVASLDGKPFWQGDVGGDAQTKAIDQQQDRAVDAINKTLKHIDFQATAGPHVVAVTFLHRDFAESEGRLQPLSAGDAQAEVLRLRSFSIRGPLDVTGMSWTPSRRKIFTCMPLSPQDDQPCARQIITTLAREAYRRPVTSADVDPLMTVYTAGAKDDSFETGVRDAITAILASPFFLYRAEPTPVGVAPGQTYPITDLELASRLAFFLWSSDPDNELITLGAQNRLHEPAVLKAEVLRMLKDPRALTLASNFAFQWLDVDRLAEVKPDQKDFPGVGDPRPLYRDELKLFVNSVFADNLNVVDLLTANWTYLNQDLALLYGINDVRGTRFRRVELSDPVRFGLLGKGAFLMGQSYPTRTAPVLRGKWVLDSILDAPPDPPPPGVKMNLPSEEVGAKALTVRQEMVIHRSNPSCFACHGVLDPLGLAFQNFDAVGRWHTMDRYAHATVDASATLPGGFKVDGPVGVRKFVLRDPSRFVTALTQNLMTYALGRTLDYQDQPEVRAIVQSSAEDDYRFASIVMGIVSSPEFLMRTAPPAASVKTVQVLRPVTAAVSN
jgi:mono/diheme cytochrome c family protein